MRFSIAAAVAGLALVSVPASATTVTVTALGPAVISDGNFGGGLATFDSISSIEPAIQPQFTVGDATFTGSGIVVTDGTTSGLYAQPYNDNTQYLSVQPGGPTETITFSNPHGYTELGLYWGSMDTYNSIAFFNGSTQIGNVSGTDAAASISSTPVGTQIDPNYSNNRFIIIDLSTAFTSIVLTSTSNSFEFDNLTWGPRGGDIAQLGAAPLPGALALFAGGLGMIGLVAGRKRRKTVGLASGIAGA